ncbi:hypothetical protein [Pseudemcibacter aquimaris]|uniref:hypothetical protein n=1 Tax=Pseudemcibacter aquimaris TaxID=2857064 RepID=UPI0020115A82|nr:hypothetical protein [Pseudemcibacter aquimaris]MCC3859709.1 hypothetical protein [Pseudemcibacter aquimaris]WDU60104.1 hypothetical protein KW060_07515 [Pseudemcibacter aquimaris]
MVQLKTNITRRGFGSSLLAAMFVFQVPIFAHSTPIRQSKADGLLHLDQNGVLHIYSGGGQSGPYCDEDSVSPVLRTLKINRYRIQNGNNPDHLPGILAQHKNHLSFTNEKTNLYAAQILKSIIGTNKNYIEDGISAETRKLVDRLNGNGIIVAVKERV